MQQIIKRYFWITLLAAGLQSSWGFALLGPLTLANGADNWQNNVIGYDYVYADDAIAGDPVFLGDIGGPRNISEGYRRNEPVVYYTYDETFFGFFGADGEAAVDGAFGVMNALPPVDQINLSAYPDQSIQNNFTAQADYLTDLKSVTLHLLVEQMGLADPERFMWTLHDRYLIPGGTCPLGETYIVVQRNYADTPSAINQTQYSSYINDSLFTYYLVEDCIPPNPLAFTVPLSTDPNAEDYQSVAANNFDGLGLNYLQANQTVPTMLSGGLQVGSFYTGLTRDDVAGIYYLYHTNNVAWEMPDPSAQMFLVTTDFTQQVQFPNPLAINPFGTNGGFYAYDGVYGYGDYSALIASALTNSPAVLQTLYPGLITGSSYSYLGYVTNYTYTQYYTNQVGVQYPPPLVLVTVTNKHVTMRSLYQTTLVNVFPFTNNPMSRAYLQTVSVQPSIGAQYPAPLVTNVSNQKLTLNTPSGYFLVFPLYQTNICPLDLFAVGLTNVLAITNNLSTATTNVATATNTSYYSTTLYEIYLFTNYTWKAYPVTCGESLGVANAYQGIGHVQFVRRDYDTPYSQIFHPITNSYNMVVMTNSQWHVQPFTRVVIQPDILIDATDQGAGNAGEPFIGTVIRNINFTPSPNLNGLAGPGAINNSAQGLPPIVFSYDKIGNSVWNGYDFQTIISDQYLDERESIPALRWASFDASTNAPELYPNGTLYNLENQIAVSLSPSSPPNGYVGAPYSVQFNASGGGFATPFYWSYTGAQITTGLYYGLPPGLALSSSGLIYGTPTSAGTYDFALTLQDSASHTVTWNLSITIQ